MMARRFRQVDEGFKWVCEGKTAQETIDRLKEFAAGNQCVVPIVRIGVGAEKPAWDLAEGAPDLTKLETDIPEGMGRTTLTLEWRRITQFYTAGSNMNNLTGWKREQQWVNTLEAIHHGEATLLTAVKDGKLLELYPLLEPILKDIGITEYNKPKQPKKSRAKKNVKANA
jgi:hypothetical protein